MSAALWKNRLNKWPVAQAAAASSGILEKMREIAGMSKLAVRDVHPNHRYLVYRAIREVGSKARILDYGCGAGEAVAHGRSRGLDMVGADVFYAGSNARRTASAAGRLGKTVLEMKGGRLPFPDGHFDMICANQVFEHVRHMDDALLEVRRTLRPGGVFLNLFPSMSVLREGHCGIPLAHWLNGRPQVQRRYLYAWRCLGFGYFTANKTRRCWATDFSAWLRLYTCYRSERDIISAHLRYFERLERDEHHFAAFRLSLKGRCRPARLARKLPAMTRTITSRLGTMVLVARKPF